MKMPSRPHREQIGQSVKQNWDGSKMENEEEEGDEDWHKGDQMEVQWDEDEKLKVILERRRVEGGSLHADDIQKVLELVVHQRMSQDKKTKGVEEKKKVKRWSTEEMKNKPCDVRREDSEEMIAWKTMSQEEVDNCWKKLAEKREEEVLDKYKVENSITGAYKGKDSLLEWRRARRSRRHRIRKWREDCWAIIFVFCSENVTCSVRKACMKTRRKEKR